MNWKSSEIFPVQLRMFSGFLDLEIDAQGPRVILCSCAAQHTLGEICI